MLEDGSYASGDIAFGIRVALTYQLENLPLLRSVLYHAPTPAVALKHLVEYFSAIQSYGVLRLSIESDLISLEYQYRDGLVAERRHIAEMMLVLIVRMLEECVPGCWSLKAFRFVHLRGREAREIQALLRAPAMFGSKLNAVVFSSDRLNKRRVGVDSRDTTYYQEQLSKLRHGERLRHFLPNLAFEIHYGIALRESSMEHVAHRIGVSRASLFRKLAGIGIQFGELVMHIRMAMACYYLEKSQIPLHEIAYIVGYSEHSAFTRAFTYALQMSPSEFRRRARALLRTGVSSQRGVAFLEQKSTNFDENIMG